MDEVDRWIPTPTRDTDKPFLMPIEDVVHIQGRGTVVTGRVERGSVLKGQEIEIIGLREEKIKTIVTGIEIFHKELDSAAGGDNAGLLRGTKREEVERGMVWPAGSITPYRKFMAEVYVLKRKKAAHKAFVTATARSSSSAPWT